MIVKVIINADDLGKNSNVNKAIAKAFSEGEISSATIMANSDTWDEVHQIINQNPHASFGVHLNLTEGKALTESPVLVQSGIVDENNCFTKNVRNLSVYTPKILQAVKDEWFAQIKKVTETEGISVTHIDGHHHIHTFYPFYEIFIDCLKSFGISKFRNRYNYPRNYYSAIAHGVIRRMHNSDTLFNILKRLKSKNAFLNVIYNIIENERWCKRVNQNIITTTYFDSYEHFCREVKFMDEKDATIELMCHPGHPAFEAEYSAITNHQLEKLIAFKLISYKELC